MPAALLKQLNELVASQSLDAEEGARFTPVTEAQLNEAEGRVGPLPKSYRAFVLEHGRFEIGADPAFQLVEPEDIRTMLDELMSMHDAEDAAGVADSIGIEQDVIEAMAHGVIIAMEGHEDYWVFDTRTRDDQGECRVIGCLTDDLELEYFAKKSSSKGRAFEAFLSQEIQRMIDDLG